MARVITKPEIGRRYNALGVVEITDCPHCGIQHGVPQVLMERARAENAAAGKSLTLYCPLGHAWHFTGKNEEQQLRDRLQREKERRARTAAERDQAEASRRAQAGAASRARHERDRVRARAAAGVCPCCSRSFKQLRRHMKSKHPDFDPTA